MSDAFGAPWEVLGRTVVLTVAMYVTGLAAVRVAGRRTVARISAFDVLVTIAIGTILGSTAISREPSYARAATALVTLLAMQVLVAAVRRRWAVTRRVLDFPPIAVVRDGTEHLSSSPLGPQLTSDELRSLLRRKGIFDLDGVRVVILEPGGAVSVREDGPLPPAVS